jgi:hypothetical protein
MDIEHLPIRYRVEIYEDSFWNDPSAAWHSTTPFLGIHVGDFIDPRTWCEEGSLSKPLQDNQLLRVKSVNHLLYNIKGSHVGHSLSVCVETVAKPN